MYYHSGRACGPPLCSVMPVRVYCARRCIGMYCVFRGVRIKSLYHSPLHAPHVYDEATPSPGRPWPLWSRLLYTPCDELTNPRVRLCVPAPRGTWHAGDTTRLPSPPSTLIHKGRGMIYSRSFTHCNPHLTVVTALCTWQEATSSNETRNLELLRVDWY